MATARSRRIRSTVSCTTLQELATRIAHHRNTGTFTQDPLIEKLTARIATDENLHYVFYRELGKAALEIVPSEMMLAIDRQVTGFSMPGLDIPEFKQKAIEIAKARIYDLRIPRRGGAAGPVQALEDRQGDRPVRRGRAGPRRHHELPVDARRDGNATRRSAARGSGTP